MIIKLEKFEGPLGLLLRLIEKEEMAITEVSLVKVTDQYIEFIKKSPDIDPEHIADFLVVASKLLLLKSRALLPYLYPDEDEEIDDFENQIRMYKQYLEACKKVEKLAARNKLMFAREFSKKSLNLDEKKFLPPKGIEMGAMAETMRDILARIRPPEDMDEETVEDQVNIEDKILSVREILSHKVNFAFNELIKSAKSRTEVIVGFLAVLELMKQREVVVEQVDLFSDISIKRQET